MMDIILWIFAISIMWFAIGWLFVIVSDLITSDIGKKAVTTIEKLANRAESISPWLVLLFIFGPIGFILKKNLYDRPPKL